MHSIFFNYFNEETWTNIRFFMKQLNNLSSLIIVRYRYRHGTYETIENIHSIIPHHIKHLQTPITHLDQILPILERCENLSTIIFHFDPEEFFEYLIDYFDKNTIYTTCVEKQEPRGNIIAVWLRKKTFNQI